MEGMTGLSIVLDVETTPIKELQGIRPKEGRICALGGLPRATENGNAGVVLVVEHQDGTVVFAETTMKLFLTAAIALRARYGDPDGLDGAYREQINMQAGRIQDLDRSLSVVSAELARLKAKHGET